jgi:hypothetical protein
VSTVEPYQGFDVREGSQSMVADYRDPGFVEIVHGLDWTPQRVRVDVLEGLVTGFYYARRRDENPVEEGHGPANS